MTTTTDFPYSVGDEVLIQTPDDSPAVSLEEVGNYYNRISVTNGTRAVIRQINANKVKVFFEEGGHRHYTGNTPSYSWTAWIEKDYIVSPDPSAPKPRKIGEVPDGGISPDDPRIAWLWEDAAKLANRQNYCSQYDTITGVLGIPGRERDFSVKQIVNGITLSTSVKARSQREANALVEKALGITESVSA